MKKIKSLFKRDLKTKMLYAEVNEGSEWVQNGEGKATRKYDGTACMIKDNVLYKRYDAKWFRKTPKDGIPCEPTQDENTGHWPWWIPVDKERKENKWHVEAFLNIRFYVDGTYELVGPKINGNKESYERHVLIPHGSTEKIFVPTDFEGLKKYFEKEHMEGIVWHHPDGRMVKVKKKDFGLRW